MAELPLQVYERTTTNTQGYKTFTSLKVSPVVLGNDVEALATAWAQVGGSGDIPCTAGTPEKEISSFVINPETSGYAFGTISFKNLTEGFPPAGYSYTITGLSGNGAVGIGFTDGARCQSLLQAHLAPKWQDDQWGPVPIVIAVWNYRTPANPDGDPKRIPNAVRIGSVQFQLSAAAER